MKAHLVRTDTPLVPDRTVTGMCGTVVKNARDGIFQNLEVIDVVVYLPGMCKKCFALNAPDPKRRLVYWVVNNQELIVERGLRV